MMSRIWIDARMCPEFLQCRGQLNRLSQGRRAKPEQNGEFAWVMGIQELG